MKNQFASLASGGFAVELGVALHRLLRSIILEYFNLNGLIKHGEAGRGGLSGQGCVRLLWF